MLNREQMIHKPVSRPNLSLTATTGGEDGMDGRADTLAGLPPASAFAARVAQAGDQRLAQGVAALVAQLARLIAEAQLTRDDMRAILAFLTEVGETCSEQRQEWVLLADTLGLTSAVEAQMAQRPAGATPNTLPGPFYRPDAPMRADGESISLDAKGGPLTLRAEVVDLDGQPVPGAQVEVWQANADGLYENQEPDQQPEYNLRGLYRTDAAGRVTIRTVRPAGYPIPADGPVGRLMARLGIALDRPAHIHVRITAPGFQRLTTHVFDASDPAIDRDPLFAVHPALLATFDPAPKGGFTCAFRFVLARARPGADAQ